ncbi:MAG: beta-galactosidase [Phycisphaerae bacterium]
MRHALAAGAIVMFCAAATVPALGQEKADSRAILDFDRGQMPDDTSNVSASIFDGNTQYEGGFSLKIRALDAKAWAGQFFLRGPADWSPFKRAAFIVFNSGKDEAALGFLVRTLAADGKEKVTATTPIKCPAGFSEHAIELAELKDDSGKGQALDVAKVTQWNFSFDAAMKSPLFISNLRLEAGEKGCGKIKAGPKRQTSVDFLAQGPPKAQGLKLDVAEAGGKKAWALTGPGRLTLSQPALGNWMGLTALLISFDSKLEDFVRATLYVKDSQSRGWATLYSRTFLIKPGENAVRVNLVGLTASDQKKVICLGDLTEVELELATPKGQAVALTGLSAVREKVQNMILVDCDAGDMPSDTGPGAKVSLAPGHTKYAGGFSIRLDLIGQNAWAGVFGETRANWEAWDRVAFDVENTNEKPVSCTWVMKNKMTGSRPSLRSDQPVEIKPGLNSYYVGIQDVRGRLNGPGTEPKDPTIDLSEVYQWSLTFDNQQGAAKPLYISNWRLERGQEGSGSIALMEGRPKPPEMSVELKDLRAKAVAARDSLAKLVDQADAKGIDTHYFKVYLTCAELGLEARWYLPLQERNLPGYCKFIASSCATAADELQQIIDGKKKALQVPPVPDYRQVKREGGAMTFQGKPVILFSLSGDPAYFAPGDYIDGVSAVGASRYDVEETPIYKVYAKDPSSHRAGYSGWCGHIIRDIWSLGGGKDPVVICLESPAMRDAIKESITTRLDAKLAAMKKAGAEKSDLNSKIAVSMGYEYMYICYCEESRGMFAAWLKNKYGQVEKANEIWGTKLASFDDIKLTPHDKLTDNRAYMYDWLDFNFRRVCDYMKWAKGVMQARFPAAPYVTGSSYLWAGGFAFCGFDMEMLNNEVCDVVLPEAGATTIETDLYRDFTDTPKVVVDPEYHGDIPHLMAQFLHGTSAMTMWHWPSAAPVSESAIAGAGFSAYITSVPHSYKIPLEDVALCLRTALDVRRLGGVIQPFQFPPYETAILYSRTTAIQVDKEMLNAGRGPALTELENIFDGARVCDVPVRFVTERQAAGGMLKGVKLLWVPSATHLPATAFKAITDFAEGGGTVVITPNSLQFDEYHRAAPYLGALGVNITRYRRPKVTVGEPTRDTEEGAGFLQGLSSKTTLSEVPKEKITVLDEGVFKGLSSKAPALNGAGVMQTLELKGDAKAIATFADGKPAIVEIPRGKGRILYLAMPLETPSVTALADWLTGKLAITRPLEVTAQDGGRIAGVEARCRISDDGMVAYIWNLSGADQTLKMKPAFKYSSIANLGTETPHEGLTINVPNKETVFLLFRK